MLNLGDYKKSRFYKETRKETFAEVIQKMSRQGFTPESIAQAFEMDLATVKKILKEKPKK